MTTQVHSQGEANSAVVQMVEIITAGWDPLQIILFGSRARGDHHADSDIDLLVVMDEVKDYPALRSEIERALDCTKTRRDVKLATPAEVVRRATVAGTIERAAMVEGRTLYVRGRGDPVAETVSDWLKHARVDFRAARHWLTANPTEPLLGCFHAQQAAKKSLKAALVAERIDPPRTHDLNELSNLLPLDWQIPTAAEDLERLSGWAAKSRYPSASAEFSDSLAAWGIDIAQALYDAVAAGLTRRGYAVP